MTPTPGEIRGFLIFVVDIYVNVCYNMSVEVIQ